PTWRHYYAAAARVPATRALLVRRSLGTVAFDVPMIIALFLLLSLRADLKETPVQLTRLNAKRIRCGKHPLLEHVEVSSPVFASAQGSSPREELATPRTGSRFHHVRGHIVRRQNQVFWRRAHWRGHLRLGSVRSRTVVLTTSRT